MEENLPVRNLKRTDPFIKKIIFSFLFLVILIFIFYLFIFTAPMNFPKGSVLTVGPGDSLRSLSGDLKDKNIIRSRVAFESFVIIFGGEKHIAPGDYLLENKMPVFEIAKRISNKDRRLAPVKITIPEGFDINQIADIAVSKLKFFNRDTFILNTKDKEGYLFPDTYFFFTTDNEINLEKQMSENFDKKISKILPEIDSSGKTEKEIITMASIIEREAKGNNDRDIISGILWNRIKKNMPLQVDAVPATYKVKGLPESPICNPGLEAIRAAIYPVSSNYLFYLHDKNGLIHYAKTFAEHKKNIIKYLK